MLCGLLQMNGGDVRTGAGRCGCDSVIGRQPARLHWPDLLKPVRHLCPLRHHTVKPDITP